ncbi:toxin VasX [Aliivibrio wodanis]|uniref:toxin VasX n=1 Tax=Aliivibrio wodanis TaxID=80852 RepID=UPI00406C60F5
MSEANNAAMCGSKKDAKNPVGACPVKFGVIDIIPVRYAIDDMDNEEKEQKHPLLDTHKGHGFFDVAHSKYTLRQLRDGWLYVYSNKDKTFHEYQVKGTQFIKIDWGSNEADKAPEERGQAGEAKSCLSYSKNDTLTISFSHQRWTWRLCEHMRSNTQCRNEWMRTVDLKTYSNTLEIEHGGGMRDFVHAVADIGTPKPSDTLFGKTCSPLKDDDPSDDEFHLASHKKTVLETDYQCDLLEKNSALYIALDD